MKKHTLARTISCASGYEIEDEPSYDCLLTYEGDKRGHPILMGPLGQTQCCGAASIFMPYMPADSMALIDLFKSSGKSILHYIGGIKGIYNDNPRAFLDTIKHANLALAGIAEISMTSLNEKEHVLVFQIKNLQKTREFFASMA